MRRAWLLFMKSCSRSPPVVEGQHYGFDSAQLAVYNPGQVNVVNDKNMSLMFYAHDVLAEYDRLMQAIPGIGITSPPERRPWGAYSFWFLDPDGNTVSFIEKKDLP